LSAHTSHIVPVRVYIGVFLALFILTIVTTWIAFQDLGRFNLLVALGIAIFKASLVVLFFMHVKYSTTLTKAVVVSGIVFFMVMVFFTMSDLLTRGWMGVNGR
jgi:cytochrome c oxidase subunit 4